MDKKVTYILAIFLASAFIVTAYYNPAGAFLFFVAGWLFFIPAAFIVYLVYGFLKYNAERKDRITVTMKPTEAMKALARREAELKREKERIFYEMGKQTK
ncbi:Uncharacterised protein [uncultured archaeon]|nr:Uncharacterised protein [uncultured archaeon]